MKNFLQYSDSIGLWLFNLSLIQIQKKKKCPLCSYVYSRGGIAFDFRSLFFSFAFFSFFNNCMGMLKTCMLNFTKFCKTFIGKDSVRETTWNVWGFDCGILVLWSKLDGIWTLKICKAYKILGPLMSALQNGFFVLLTHYGPIWPISSLQQPRARFSYMASFS